MHLRRTSIHKAFWVFIFVALFAAGGVGNVRAEEAIRSGTHIGPRFIYESFTVKRHFRESEMERKTSLFVTKKDEDPEAWRNEAFTDVRWNLGYGLGWTQTPEQHALNGTVLPPLNDLTHAFRAGLGFESYSPFDFSFELGMDTIPSREYRAGMLSLTFGYAFSLSADATQKVEKEYDRYGREKKKPRSEFREKKTRKAYPDYPSMVVQFTASWVRQQKNVANPTGSDPGLDGSSISSQLDIYQQIYTFDVLFSPNNATGIRSEFSFYNYIRDVKSFLTAMRTPRTHLVGIEGVTPLYKGFPQFEWNQTVYWYVNEKWELDLGFVYARFQKPAEQYIASRTALYPTFSDLVGGNVRASRLFGNRWQLGAGLEGKSQDSMSWIGSIYLSYFL